MINNHVFKRVEHWLVCDRLRNNVQYHTVGMTITGFHTSEMRSGYYKGRPPEEHVPDIPDFRT
jgi:hypothetical protein